jgi:hypothetical protein
VTEPRAPDPGFPRLTERPLPAYRFVPGFNAHPFANPAGHSFGQHVEADCDEVWTAERDWRASPRFCYGVDLYNYAYWWEAHEYWEPLWKCCPLDHPLRHFLQGLIQVSAAHLTRHMGRCRGCAALEQRAGARLQRALQAAPVFLGVDVGRWWAQAVRPYFAAPDERPYPFLRPS